MFKFTLKMADVSARNMFAQIKNVVLVIKFITSLLLYRTVESFCAYSLPNCKLHTITIFIVTLR